METNSKQQVGFTQRLADFAANTGYGDLPDTVVEYAKRLILDTIACTIGGHCVQPRHNIMLEPMTAVAGKPEATILVTGEKVDCITAAMINAEAGGAFSAQDSFFHWSHSANLTLSNALAMGERVGAGGRDLILAFVIGFEITAVLDLLMPKMHLEDGQPALGGMIAMPDYMTIGGAAAAGNAVGLDAGKMSHCLGIAAVTGPTGGDTMRNRLSMLNYMVFYPKAHSGMMAALLAQNGCVGYTDLLDGPLGVMPFADTPAIDRAVLAETLGAKWWILEDSIKHLPSCRYLCGPMDLLMKIKMEHQLKAEEVEEVTVWLTPLAMSVPPEGDPSYAPDPSNGGTPFDIVFNAPYQVAMILLGVPAGPEWYKPERYVDPEVRSIMAKVKLGLDTEAGLQIGRQARDEFTRRFKLSPGTGITVKARGQAFAGRCAYIPGDPWCPETRTPDSVLVEKFRTYGEPYLSKAKLDRAVDALIELESVSNLRDLTQLLTRD